MLLFLLAVCGQCGAAGELATETLVSSRGCCAATAGTGNKIITYRGKTHVAWLNSTEEGFFSVVRTLDRSTGKWSPTYTLGQARDDHGRPALTIDSQGYLHAIYGVHHNQIPYRRSRRPNDASEWTDVEVFGGRLTYPTLICGPDDQLFLTGRFGWEGVRLYVRPPGEKWTDRGLIIRRNPECISYAAFHEGLAWGPDHKTLHLSCQFFQGKSGNSLNWGTMQSVNYMVSRDFGRTWERADGSHVAIPATASTMDVLAAEESFDPKPGLRNTGAVVVDSKNRPYVLYYRNTPARPGQVFLVRANRDGQWQHLPLQAAMDKYYSGWAVVDCRAGFTITADDRLCMALTLAPIDHPDARWDGKPLERYFHEPAYWQNFFPKARRIGWLESGDAGRSFISKEVLEKGPDVACLQQSIEMPTGFNAIPAGARPGLLYHTGVSSNPDGRIIDNDVFYVHVR
ncbi:MAG: BNR repeat-containing protein [Fuerstiella sp.]|nr:BNR repeat-containing protein [Fuerstiella sp.]